MKRSFILFALTISLGLIFSLQSCKKDKVYSCNEGLNNYAAMTWTAYQSISRSDLAKMGIDTQFAIINSLSPENNARILKEKIAVLFADATVPDADKEHLQDLSDYVTGDIYANPHPEQDAFLKNWRAYAFDTLQWSEAKMQIYVYTWMTHDEFMHAPEGGGEGSGGQLSCNCDGGYMCETILGKRCESVNCAKTTWGCGFLWTQSCSGRCSI